MRFADQTDLILQLERAVPWVQVTCSGLQQLAHIFGQNALRMISLLIFMDRYQNILLDQKRPNMKVIPMFTAYGRTSLTSCLYLVSNFPEVIHRNCNIDDVLLLYIDTEYIPSQYLYEG